jgi:ankyrin repeat protein
VGAAPLNRGYSHADSESNMEIRIVESNRFGELTAAKLKAFEDSLGATLPDGYRTHLLEHNGGHVDGVRRLGDLDQLYGIHDGPTWAQLRDPETYGGMIPEQMLPIGDDPGGNLICVVLSGPERGAICFWDHERGPDSEKSITRLAPDFEAYLRGLAIRVAVARKRAKFIREVIREPGVNAPIYAGQTILDLALERGSLRIIRMLITSGATIPPDAVIEAVRNKAINTVRFLLARGVDVNYSIPDTGFTALMLAASRDAVQVAELLLAKGANATPRNKWGKTAAQLAHSSRMKKLLGAK